MAIPAGFDARVLEHVTRHPGLSSYELARVLGPGHTGPDVSKYRVDQALMRLFLDGKITFEKIRWPAPGGCKRIWHATESEKPSMTHDEIVAEIQARAAARGIFTHYCRSVIRCVGTPGMPDIFLVGRCTTAWIEVKTPGDRLKPDQIRWKYMLQAAGQLYDVMTERDLAPDGGADRMLDFLDRREAETAAGPCYGIACDHVSHRTT